MSKKQVKEEQPQQKVMTKYDRKVQRREAEKAREKKEKLTNKIIGIAVVVLLACLVISFPIRSYLTTHETYVVVDGEAITKLEFDYQYNVTKNSYINENGAFMSYMGYDLSGDLSDVMYSDILTFRDYFEKTTVENIVTARAIKKQAQAEGFVYDTAEEYAEFEKNVADAAADAGMTEKAYIQSLYGDYATMDRIKHYIEDSIYVSAYYAQVSDAKAPSDDEIRAYYEENKDNYDSVDYRILTISAELPTEPTELADPKEETASTETTDGSSTESEVYTPSDAEVAKAMEDAKVKADAAVETIAKDGELKENLTRSSVPYATSEWLFDETRKAGDTTVIEYEAGNCYYVVEFEQRYLDETPSADARVLITAGDGQAYLDQWKNGEATEESFAALCDEHSDDTMEGGLYEGLVKSGLDETLAGWLFDESRASGDTACITVEGDDYSYVMYYVGQDDPQWKMSIRSTLLSATMSDWTDEISAGISVEDPKGKLDYLKIEAAQAAMEAASEETSEASSSESESK